LLARAFLQGGAVGGDGLLKPGGAALALAEPRQRAAKVIAVLWHESEMNIPEPNIIMIQ
jgi:hypothetical protein